MNEKTRDDLRWEPPNKTDTKHKAKDQTEPENAPLIKKIKRGTIIAGPTMVSNVKATEYSCVVSKAQGTTSINEELRSTHGQRREQEKGTAILWRMTETQTTLREARNRNMKQTSKTVLSGFAFRKVRLSQEWQKIKGVKKSGKSGYCIKTNDVIHTQQRVSVTIEG